MENNFECYLLFLAHNLQLCSYFWQIQNVRGGGSITIHFKWK